MQPALDGFAIRTVPDGYKVTVTRHGHAYAWLHLYSTRDYARQCCAAVAPWPIAWYETPDGELVGMPDATIADTRDEQ